MDLTISNEISGQIYGPLEVSEEMTLKDLISLIEADCSFDSRKHDLYHNMDILDLKEASKALKNIGLNKDDLLLIRNKVMQDEIAPVSDLSDDEFVEQFRNEVLRNEMLRSQMVLQIPGFDAMLNDPQSFRERLGPLILQRCYAGSVANGNGTLPGQNPFGIPQEEYNILMSNPDDPENQKKITELINQQDIDEQMRNALEYTPEVFTTVHMLFINLEINGYAVKAFVDTGAQMTILSTRLAEKTGLNRLIDKRFIGEAHGVGVGKILGKIHQAQIKIETQFIPCSFTVLDTPMDLLIGLDMLKRHQACVDLEHDVLRIAGVETKFLNESEIPKAFGSENSVQIKETPKDSDKVSKSISLSNPSVAVNSNTTSKLKNSSVSTTRNVALTDNHISAKTYPEFDVKKLIDLGFSRSEAIRALNQTGGNVDFAASLLFQ